MDRRQGDSKAPGKKDSPEDSIILRRGEGRNHSTERPPGPGMCREGRGDSGILRKPGEERNEITPREITEPRKEGEGFNNARTPERDFE